RRAACSTSGWSWKIRKSGCPRRPIRSRPPRSRPCGVGSTRARRGRTEQRSRRRRPRARRRPPRRPSPATPLPLAPRARSSHSIRTCGPSWPTTVTPATARIGTAGRWACASTARSWRTRRPPAAVPAVKRAHWPKNPVDAFVLARIEKEGLAPSPEAGPRELLRRLSLDLTGLPPTPEELRAFLGDEAPGAYERQVDRLLASPHFGERMALYWLDLVRYADSAGYHSDNPRTVWRYRDYVIGAFNRNLPFDQFTAVQLAGDLLPDASLEQRIASGYNRLLQTTEEGGAQPKEYRAIYLADRVRNASTVWLGATLGCAQCHNHKFDPYLAKDFYSFAAFFADV